MNDTLRGLIIGLIQSLFPVLEILDVVSFTGDEIATLMLFLTNTVTLLFWAIKYGQQSSGSSSTVSATITTEPNELKP